MKPLTRKTSRLMGLLGLLVALAPGAQAGDEIRIALLHANGTTLASLDPEARHQILRQWGDGLVASDADIVFVSDLGTPLDPNGLEDDSLEVLGNRAQMYGRHQVSWDPSYPDVAILSTFDIIDAEAHALPGGKKLLEATIRINGRDHRVFATHFAGSASDHAFPTRRRIESSSRILELIAGETNVILGGDFEACPGVFMSPPTGPMALECAGANAEGIEYRMLSTALTDAFVAFGRLMPQDRCSDRRVDHVFFRGPYEVVDYEECPFDAAPSEHPSIVMTLEYHEPTPTPTATPTRTPLPIVTPTRTPTLTPTPTSTPEPSACPYGTICCPDQWGQCVCIPDSQECAW